MAGDCSDGEVCFGGSVGVHFEICLTQWKRLRVLVAVLSVSSS